MSAEKERLWAGKHTAAEVGNGRNPLRRRLLSHLRYSGFFGQMLNYGLGSILQKLLGILLLPLYIHALHPAELGALALIEVCQTFFTALGSLGIPYALLRFATDGSSSIGTLLRTSVVCSAVPGLVLSGALMLGFQGLLGLMRLDSSYSQAMLLGLGLIPLQILQNILQNIWRIEARARRFSLLMTLQAAVLLLSTAWMVIPMGLGIRGILLGRYAGTALLLLCGAWQYGSVIVAGHLDRDLGRRMLGFGLPLIPHKLNLLLNSKVDRLLLQYMLGPAAVGIYELAFRVATYLQSALSPLESAFLPYVIRHQDRKDRTSNLGLVTNFMLLAIVLGTLGLLYGGPLLVHWADVGGKYPLPEHLMALLVLGMMVSLTYNVVAYPLYTNRRTKMMPLISGLGMASNILGNLWLIPAAGPVGAAWATLFSNSVMTSLGHWASRRQQGCNLLPGLSLVGLVMLVVVGWLLWGVLW